MARKHGDLDPTRPFVEQELGRFESRITKAATKDAEKQLDWLKDYPGPCMDPTPRCTMLPVEEKIEWSCMPWDQIEQLAHIFHAGAKKHGHRGYESLCMADFPRYFSKVMRHITSGMRGEVDPETGESHFLHAAADLMILAYLDGEFSKNHLPSDRNQSDTSPTSVPAPGPALDSPSDVGDMQIESLDAQAPSRVGTTTDTFVGMSPSAARHSSNPRADRTLVPVSISKPGVDSVADALRSHVENSDDPPRR